LEKRYFEIIRNDKQVKFYFDTDHVFYEDFDKYEEEMAKNILTIHKTYLTEAFQKLDFVPIFAVAESHSKERIENEKKVWGYTFHIVIPNIIGYKKDMKEFAQKLNIHIHEHQNTYYILKYKDDLKNINIEEKFDDKVHNPGMQKF
jgi:hypothetical protein